MKVRGLSRLAFVAVILLGLTGLSFAQFGVSISIGVAPPPLPVYDQPPIPDAGYIWTPGYWAWSDDGYYWVPGTWVQPPQEGLLWTPGYWGYDDDDNYAWNDGYWGTEVGFYGGVDYGYGYGGDGYAGGYWQGNNFYYNNAVNNISTVHITNVYTKQVVQNNSSNRVSFNGGNGGTQARPTPQQTQARSAHHVEATPAQRQQVQAAKSNPQMLAKNNNGKPAVAATSKPGDFSHAVQAKAAGGRIDPKVMQANAQNTPKGNAKSGGRPGNEPGRATTPTPPASANDRNAPKPAGNEAARPTTPSSANERNVPKPPNAGPDNNPARARGNEPSTARPEPGRPETGRPEPGAANGMPQSESGRRPAASPDRTAAPPARDNERPANNNAAPKERPNAPDKNNGEKPKPDKNDKPE